MKKLIKADLTGILELVPVYQPVEADRIDRDIAKLRRHEAEDYLFLARRGLCRLSTMTAAYDQYDSANADWMAFRGMTMWPVLALFLHVDWVAEGRPWGSVTLLDYQAVAKDIATFSPLSQAQRERHIKLLVKRYTQRPGLCSMLDVIHYLKTGEVKKTWT